MEEKLMKAFQNILAYPYAWEKAGLGDVPVEKAAAFARDRAAHLVSVVLLAFEAPEDDCCNECGCPPGSSHDERCSGAT